MLDREEVEAFFSSELDYLDFDIPENISREELIEAFYEYMEGEAQEWMRDNLSTFFNGGDPDWESIRAQIGKDEE